MYIGLLLTGGAEAAGHSALIMGAGLFGIFIHIQLKRLNSRQDMIPLEMAVLREKRGFCRKMADLGDC